MNFFHIFAVKVMRLGKNGLFTLRKTPHARARELLGPRRGKAGR